MNKPLKVFITYTRTDREAKYKLITSLAVMERQGFIEIWHDEKILGGDRWQEEIFSKHVPTSDLLLYLVSAGSLASENCYKELEIALEKGVRVVPIIFADCNWKNDQLRDFQVFPNNGLPITKWDNESEGWQDVVDGIRKTVSKLESQSDPSSSRSGKDLQAELAFERGNVRFLLGELSEAIEAYSDVIKIDPYHASVYYNRGNAYRKRGEVDLAIKDYTTAIQLKLNFLGVYYNRGLAYSKKGEVELAIEDYTKAIGLQPDYAEAYYNRGGAFLRLGEREKAKSDLAIARHLGNEDITAVDKIIRDYDRAWKALGNL